MSELAILLMLALSKNFQQMVRNQDHRVWERWSPPLLDKKKVGILEWVFVGQNLPEM